MTKARTNADNVAGDISGVTAGTGLTGGGTSGTVTLTNDMATTINAAGDLIYGTGNDAYTRLALGTARQTLLTNAGATAPEWAASPQSLMTATGDILYASAANTPAKLAIGTTSQVLTVSGGLPSWATPVSGSMTLLSTTSLSGTQTLISGISQSYLHLFITIEKVTMNAGCGEFYMQPNNTSDQQVLYVANSTWSNSTGAILIFNGGLNATPENRNAAGIWIFNYASTSAVKAILAAGGNYANSSPTQRGFVSGGTQVQDSVGISSILFRPSSNSMNSGTVRIYGVN